MDLLLYYPLKLKMMNAGKHCKNFSVSIQLIDIDVETFPYPIYFAFESKPLMEAYESLRDADSESNENKDKCTI